MYDELRCKAPLPDGFNAVEVSFQTKSLPDPCLFTYTITADGRLLDEAGNDCEPDGYIGFYTQDSKAEALVEDKDEAGWREYRARFCNGQLHSIVRLSHAQRAEDSDRYYGLASFRWFAPALGRTTRLGLDLPD